MRQHERHEHRWEWTGGEGWYGVELLEMPDRGVVKKIYGLNSKRIALEVVAALNAAYSAGYDNGYTAGVANARDENR